MVLDPVVCDKYNIQDDVQKENCEGDTKLKKHFQPGPDLGHRGWLIGSSSLLDCFQADIGGSQVRFQALGELVQGGVQGNLHPQEDVQVSFHRWSLRCQNFGHCLSLLVLMMQN